MALNLDARQRAMLQEMGITVWLPRSAPSATLSAAAAIDRGADTAVLEHPAPLAPQHVHAAPAVASTPQPAPAVAAAPVARAQPAPAPTSTTTAAQPVAAPTVPADWGMAPAVQLYPQATGGRANDGWLVVLECTTPADPLAGDTGKLLDNMLRALHLHESPHIWVAGLQRPGSQALATAEVDQAVDWQPLPTTLPALLERTQPARMLVLGLHAARAVLGSAEPLGRLRAQLHHVGGVPAVVSYDPAYLMRTPQAKAATWADLCRAHALQPPAG